MIRELSARPEIERLRIVVMAGTQLPRDLPAGVEVVPVNDTEDILAVLLDNDPAERPDVYHLSWFPDRSPRDLLLLLAAEAAVVEVHDAILNRHPEYHPSERNWAWYDGFVKQLVARADRLLVHSESVAGEVVDDLGGERNKCDLAPLAVDPSLEENVSDGAVSKFKRRNRLVGDYFVALGKDYPHKDYPTLFRALAQLPEEVSVVVAGDKIWRGGVDADRLLRQLGVTDRVRWMSGLTDDAVKALMQGSRGLVYPSLEEGFGLPPIEAMLRGVPVLAARSMSIPEVCGDGALLFPPGDDKELAKMMRDVLQGGALVDELVVRGRSRAASFSWSRCVDAVVECYEKARQDAASRDVGSQGFVNVLDSIASCPHSNSDVLSAWQERCLHAEQRLRDVTSERDQFLRKLRAVQCQLGQPLTPLVSGGDRRPRWSLRRRIRKIRDAVRRRFPRPSAQ